MELVTLKKKLSTYVSDGGRLRNVSEEVLYEVLSASVLYRNRCPASPKYARMCQRRSASPAPGL
jgi:hypothetical protein